MIIFIDIDETICYYDRITMAGKDRDYSQAKPILDNINKVNKLYDEGHEITYWTARGSLTGINWRELTERQLKEWGAKYHYLRLDKPYYDKFIDDKVVNARDWEND